MGHRQVLFPQVPGAKETWKIVILTYVNFLFPFCVLKVT